MIDLHLYICEYNINYELIENQYCLTDYNKLFIRSFTCLAYAIYLTKWLTYIISVTLKVNYTMNW